MIRLRGHVMDDHGPSAARATPANAAFERDGEAAVSSLVGADLEKLRSHHPVESSPMEMVVVVVQFTGDCRHDRDCVGFPVDQSGNAVVKPVK